MKRLMMSGLWLGVGMLNAQYTVSPLATSGPEPTFNGADSGSGTALADWRAAVEGSKNPGVNWSNYGVQS